ncbi:hypothetical protein Q0F99_07475 [Rathayibacter oskolensis]|uniref:hypothetical protein n=1 Tax=Rathayibacter oskolensis TaxID=1891671 RepID=UPI00265F1BF2|nr:hypothetical protein [Rathayibacter oskolensis]WKK72743.1 hypothetical protein Q0F99_07475 [Rathayibacter oskolensis]
MTTDPGPTPEQLARMRSKILSGLTPRRRRSRRRIIGFSLVVVVAIGTSAAAIAVVHASADRANTGFDCYTVADIAAEHTTTQPVDSDRDTTALRALEDRVATALEWCGASWSAVPDEPGAGTGPVDVPHPTACVLSDDRIGVFPNRDDDPTDSFCEALGATAPRL